MSPISTVVFADLSGSTSLYETMGNERAAKTVMRLTQWISEVLQAHQGRVVKMLGDGVLGIFANAHQAVAAAGELQRSHQIHLSAGQTSCVWRCMWAWPVARCWRWMATPMAMP